MRGNVGSAHPFPSPQGWYFPQSTSNFLLWPGRTGCLGLTELTTESVGVSPWRLARREGLEGVLHPGEDRSRRGAGNHTRRRPVGMLPGRLQSNCDCS